MAAHQRLRDARSEALLRNLLGLTADKPTEQALLVELIRQPFNSTTSAQLKRTGIVASVRAEGSLARKAYPEREGKRHFRVRLPDRPCQFVGQVCCTRAAGQWCMSLTSFRELRWSHPVAKTIREGNLVGLKQA